MPLESRAEQRPVPFTAGTQGSALDLRLLMGRHWKKLLASTGWPSAYAADFRTAFRVSRRIQRPADAAVCAHREAWQHQAAFARAGDGRLPLVPVARRDHPSPRTFATAARAAGDRRRPTSACLTDLATLRRVVHTTDRSAGDSRKRTHGTPRLEYRFGCSAPVGAGRKDLVAEEYYGGIWTGTRSTSVQPARRHPLDRRCRARSRHRSFPRRWSSTGWRTHAGGASRIGA